METTNILMDQVPTHKKGTKLSKEVLNIIRTTQRNNIELTHIADNKANVLLSLNAIMITFLLPMIIPNLGLISELHLYFPLSIFFITCLITIFISAQVLKPGDFRHFKDEVDANNEFSPFFFGNYYEMEFEDFFQYMEKNLKDTEKFKRFLAQDLFYIGRRLGQKMSYIRNAFSIFAIGIIVALVSTALLLFVG